MSTATLVMDKWRVSPKPSGWYLERETPVEVRLTEKRAYVLKPPYPKMVFERETGRQIAGNGFRSNWYRYYLKDIKQS